jgi:Flp pilus assembly pilin Flp
MLLRLLKNKRAQTTAEYAILLGLVAGVFIAMQLYIRRGLQGRVRDVVDHTGTGGPVAGEQFEFSGDQFEPGYTSSASQRESHSPQKEEMPQGGGFKKEIVGEQVNKGSVKSVTGWTEDGGETVAVPALPQQ